VKVIFETDALNPDEVKRATEAAIAAGADFVKTSTGFYTGGKNDGATIEMIQAYDGYGKRQNKGQRIRWYQNPTTFFSILLIWVLTEWALGINQHRWFLVSP
jgi:hypothetical protein